MKKKAKVFIIILILIAVIVLAGFMFFRVSTAQFKTAMEEMEFVKTDASNVPDGTYIGECDVTIIYAKVEVTVEDGKMVDITLLQHDNGRGSAAEGILETVMSQQTLKVDDVTGATNSSLVIKKAIDNALLNALESN